MRLVSSRSMARRSAMVAVGALAVGGLATLPVVSAGASGSPKAVAATDAVAPAAKTKKPTPKKTTITTKKCATKKKNGAVTCKTIKKTVKVTEKTTKTTKSSSSTSTTKTTKTTGTTTIPTSTFQPETHQDNPFVGVQMYVNPEWSEKAKKSGAPESIYKQPTAVWLDRIAAIEGTPDSVSNGPMGLEEHLDEALRQQAAAGKRVGIQIVVYDLPGRDCAALASNGELKATELDRYKTEYIDEISKITSQSKYASLRIIAYIEPDSLPNLVTNVEGETATENCKTVKQLGSYENGVVYALDKLKAQSNIYTYIDAGHHGWLGWENNLTKSATMFKEVLGKTKLGNASADGFVVNLANYSALEEPYLNPLDRTIGGSMLRSDTSWIDWNMSVDEKTFASHLNKALGGGFGFVIDTSRNGWGGAKRPKAASTSTDLATFVKESRIDQRIHAGNWCNQSGAGLGERPTAAPATGLDAYVWVKPPGESDGNSKEIPNTEGKGFDRMCDPTYTGNPRNKNNSSGALPDSPLAGAWFDAQFKELLKNAYPPVS